MEQFNMTMRKFIKEVGVILTGEGTGLRHEVDGEIDLSDAQ